MSNHDEDQGFQIAELRAASGPASADSRFVFSRSPFDELALKEEQLDSDSMHEQRRDDLGRILRFVIGGHSDNPRLVVQRCYLLASQFCPDIVSNMNQASIARCLDITRATVSAASRELSESITEATGSHCSLRWRSPETILRNQAAAKRQHAAGRGKKRTG